MILHGGCEVVGSVIRRTFFLVTLLVLMVWLAPAGSPQVGAQSQTSMVNGHAAVPGEALVRFRVPGPPADIGEAADADRVEAVGSHGVHRIHSRSLDAESLVKSLARRGDVVYAEPNYIVSTDVSTNDTYIGVLWGLINNGQAIGGQAGTPGADISADQAWTVTTGSKANVVGVVDTGIDYTHPDLADNVWTAPSAFSVKVGGVTISCAAGTHGFNAITKSCNPMDDHNHGTHVSGTIGAKGNNAAGVAGVNWTASIMGLKFLDASGNGTTADAINAIEFAIQVKALLGSAANVRVLSNSWGGGGFSQALLDEVNAAGKAEMLFVAAAGNSGTNIDTAPNYPASFQAGNLLAVAATDNRDGLASFSNYGASTVELGAPGVYVMSTIRNGGYGYMSGTSMATPHVSGAAALTLAACSSLTTAQLVTTMVGAVDPAASLAGKTSTGGRLNAYKAVSSCNTTTTPDYTISDSPASQSVTAGGSAPFTVSITRTGTYSLSPTLTVGGQPAGSGVTFSQNPISSSSTITIATPASAGAATYPLTITATDNNNLVRTASATLVVSAPIVTPDFSLAASPASVSVRRGSNAGTTITIARVGGLGQVSLTIAGVPSGVVATFAPALADGNSTLSFSAGTTARKSSSTLTVTGTSGSLTRTTSVKLQVR